MGRCLVWALGLVVLSFCCAAPVSAHPGVSVEIAALSRQIERAPVQLELRLSRARLLRRQGELEAAQADLRVVEHRAPGLPGLWLERALLRKAIGNGRAALADLDRYLAHDASSVGALIARAELLAAQGELARARADYDRAIRISITPELVLARGGLDERLGELERAAAGYEQGLSALGGALVVRLALVRVERSRGRFERAAALVGDLVDRSPVKAEWLLLRAEIHDQGNHPARARRDRLRALAELDRAIAARSTPLRRLQRAKAYLALGRARQARADLERVVAQAPRLDEARALLAKTTMPEGATK